MSRVGNLDIRLGQPATTRGPASWSKGGVSRPQPTDGATNHLTRGTFDAAGNLTILDDPATPGDRVTFSFDVLNRIVARQAETDLQPLYFLYTADDERALILDPDAQRSEWFRYSLRDFGGRLVRMVTEANPTETAPEPIFAAVQDVIFRGNAPLAFVGSNSSTGLELSLDHLGSIRLATNSGGQVLGWRKFYPFGEQATYPPDQVPLTLMFTGHERQSFNGLTADDDLDYMHARFRSPLNSRFLSVDPVLQAKRAQRMPQLWNRYAYGVGTPLKYVDPDGRRLQALDERALQLILAALPREIRAAVQAAVSSADHFDAAKLNAIKSESKNFAALKALADSKPLVTASTAKQASFQDIRGRRQSETLFPGTGLTLTPLPPTNHYDDSTTGFSLTGNIDVVVFGDAGGLSLDDAKTMAHELFGHAKRYVAGQPFMHDQIPGEADFQEFEDEVTP